MLEIEKCEHWWTLSGACCVDVSYMGLAKLVVRGCSACPVFHNFVVQMCFATT